MFKKLKAFFFPKITEDRVPATPLQSGLDDTFLFDFRNFQAGATTGRNISNNVIMGGSFIVNGNLDPDAQPLPEEREVKQPPTPQKIAMKPKDVLHELETVPTMWSLNNLDDKIGMLKLKEKLITQHYAKREVTALIQRLECRKKYNAVRDFFDKFDNTTDEKIQNLLDKYDLVMKTSDLFIPEFPDEAVTVMDAYNKKVLELTEKKAVFYVIAQPDKFQLAYKRRDPILLVQSPFGFYWQILGAWDEEMLLLSEL